MTTRFPIVLLAFSVLLGGLFSEALAAKAASASTKPKKAIKLALVNKGNWPETLAATRDNYQASNKVVARSGWHLCNEKFDSRDIHESYPPETSHTAFDGTRTIDGWKVVPRTEDNRFSRYLSPGQTTYIYREFHCTEDKVPLETTFAVNAGHLAAWHNGKKIFAIESENLKNPQEKTVTLTFKKGKNFILVKIAAARGGNFMFATKGTSMKQLKKELITSYGHEAALLCNFGYFKEHEQWLLEKDSDDLLKKATTKLLASLKGFPELEQELAALSKTPAAAKVAKWVELYTNVAALRREFDAARSQWEMTTNVEALRRALTDLQKTYPEKYAKLHYLEQLAAFEAELPAIAEGIKRMEKPALDRYRAFQEFRRTALLSNPKIDFEELLLVRRVQGDFSGLPNNYIGNTGISYDLDDAIVTTNLRDPRPLFKTVYKPSRKVFCGDIDLHFDAEKIAFSSKDEKGQWQVYELDLNEAEPRQVTHVAEDLDCYDPMYLPDEQIIFNCTSGYHGVPCIGGKDPIANLHIMNKEGSKIRRLCYDQDHNWYPSLLPNGRVMYLRWEYTDTAHYFSRVLMHMNPDGTDQVELYGSNSYWPNGLWYARAMPGSSSKFVAIISGHHGSTRFGELGVFDVTKGRFEATGAVQRIPGFGKPVEPIIVDGLTNGSWPKFVHPYPLSDKHFLVSVKMAGNSPTGLYLVDIYDNMLLLKELPGHMLLEPTPLRKTKRPPVLPSRVRKDAKEANVYIQDLYVGRGLRDVPRETVAALRVFQYEYGYRDYAGANAIACDGCWDVRRIVGTAPVYKDGSASFTIPANTPTSLQPLDKEGKAMALFRSWFVGMPGENVSCIGCHEDQNEAAPITRSIASMKSPVAPTPWYGPRRGFSFLREVQPVLDKYCVGCHSGTKSEKQASPDFSFDPESKNAYVKIGKSNHFTKSYAALHPYVRRNGVEGDYHTLTPLEFHADTSELIQILKKNHYGVKLDQEAWDRLITWIDLGVPFYGTWNEASRGRLTTSGDLRIQRRQELKKLYSGIDEDLETVSQSQTRLPFVEPVPPKRPTQEVKVKGWPFDAKTAKAKQGGNAAMTLELTDQIKMNFVKIPAGRFAMGSNRGEMDELPVSDTTIPKSFWMATTEVTNQQYQVFDKLHQSGYLDTWGFNQAKRGHDAGQPGSPVIRVSWEKAMKFCDWLSKKTGKKVTLPTEAQWEWACRAGSATEMAYGERAANFSAKENLADITTKKLVRGGIANTPVENPSDAEAYLPADYNSNDGAVVMTQVGSYQPNTWGLYDMHGNVQEWTRSSYQPYPYNAKDGRNTLLPAGRKVVRGGSWRERPGRATSSYRRDYPAWQSVFNVGFRVIIEE